MSSLSGMKEALKDSLTRQWDAQQQKKEQLAALAHDIKTPLTVIKGNAELWRRRICLRKTGSVRMLFGECGQHGAVFGAYAATAV